MIAFLGTEALRTGTLSRRALRHHPSPYRNVYLPPDAILTAETRAHAAWLWSQRKGILGGLSAAAWYGTRWIDPASPAELFRVNGKPVVGILIHRDTLLDGEYRPVKGITVTSPARTAFDLGRRRGRLRAVERVDALAHRTGVTPQQVLALAEAHPGVRGVVQLRQVLQVMDGGAESPQETRTRLVLVDAGLPKPRTQIEVHPYRLDMGYEEFKVGVEYDGEQHWKDPIQHAHDIDRLADLAAAGWRIVRVSARILRYRPEVIVERTCRALRDAGAQWPLIARILGGTVQQVANRRRT
ncbi:DUF559 domain-containing protein [Mycolicibacterium sp. 22603]|uniref:DUF559 domain-containing protein n=1 Tax=Mycolicibacterium sp. 22603 TaxID=3453950 RepID=UPI003F84C97F